MKAIALKLRSIIKQDFTSVAEYKDVFNSLLAGEDDWVEVDAFTDFVEDMLDLEERSINDAEMFVNLLAGRDRRLLNCFDTNVSLKDEKLIQERVEVVVYWDLIEQEKEKVIGKMKVM